MTPTTRVRESTLDDFDGIAALWRRTQFLPMSREDYVHRWMNNPARVARASKSELLTTLRR